MKKYSAENQERYNYDCYFVLNKIQIYFNIEKDFQ